MWPWLLAGIVVLLGAIGFLATRRRRTEEQVYDEDVLTSYDDTVIGAPIVAATPAFMPAAAPAYPPAAPIVTGDLPAPVADEHAEIVRPEPEEVADLTAADAPVADRPWLEFALRPVRAGISADEALVEIELTVGNSGTVKAKNVRISTFMFAGDPGNDEMDRLLIEHGGDGVQPVTIEPGAGARVDATLALPKASLIESTNGSILPVVVADARYTLADGSEGRTSARFTIGISEEGSPAMSPILLAERGMHDDVEARLEGVPEHA